MIEPSKPIQVFKRMVWHQFQRNKYHPPMSCIIVLLFSEIISGKGVTMSLYKVIDALFTMSRLEKSGPALNLVPILLSHTPDNPGNSFCLSGD